MLRLSRIPDKHVVLSERERENHPSKRPQRRGGSPSARLRASFPAPQFNYHARHIVAPLIFFRYWDTQWNDSGPPILLDRNLSLASEDFSLLRESWKGKRERHTREMNTPESITWNYFFFFVLREKRSEIRLDSIRFTSRLSAQVFSKHTHKYIKMKTIINY